MPMAEFPIVWRVNCVAIWDKGENDNKGSHGRDLNSMSVSQRRWFAVTKAQDLDEWSLVGLTRKQGLATWSAAFADRSRMTLQTSWGWVAWEAGDPERAQALRLASRIPPPVLVEIAVREPTHGDRPPSHPPGDTVTACAWSGLAGLTVGAVVGAWWSGISWMALVVAVAAAVITTVMAASWRSAHSRRQSVQILTADDAAVADVFAGAKILTWTMDHVRIHEMTIARAQGSDGTPAERQAEFREAVDQLHRALWSLANNDSDDARATLAAMTEHADLVLQLLRARERVVRASTVRVAPPAPDTRPKEPAAERLRTAAIRLHDAASSQRDAAVVIDDINRRFDETG